MKTQVILFLLMVTTIAFGQESQHLQGTNQLQTENDVMRIKDVREAFEMEVKVYPNPSEGTVFFEGLPGTTFTIYSAQGLYVGTWVIEPGLRIVSADLSQGSFICLMTSGERQLTKRIVVL